MLSEKQEKWKVIRCNQSHAQDKANGAGCGGGGCTFTKPYANFIHSHGRSLSKNTNASHVFLSSGRSFRVTIDLAVVCQTSRKEIIKKKSLGKKSLEKKTQKPQTSDTSNHQDLEKNI